MNKNHDMEMERQMAALPAGTPLLLHVCCAPCASSVLERLAQHFALTLLFYNPNIYPPAEYQKRLGEVHRLVQLAPAAWPITVLEGAYDPAAFEKAAAGMEAEPEGGARCAACFGLRLSETARTAAALGFPWFCTTLSVSPHKNAALLNEIGSEAAKEAGVRFLSSDFKKKDGYRRSIELSRQYGLYRQNYCGCAYSVREAAGDR